MYFWEGRYLFLTSGAQTRISDSILQNSYKENTGECKFYNLPLYQRPQIDSIHSTN
jgi:hypothetical protein